MAVKLPVIDLTPFLEVFPAAHGFNIMTDYFLQNGSDEDKARVGKEICEACSTLGFFYLTNHGLPIGDQSSGFDAAHCLKNSVSNSVGQSISLPSSKLASIFFSTFGYPSSLLAQEVAIFR